jgi:hypothetical protein
VVSRPAVNTLPIASANFSVMGLLSARKRAMEFNLLSAGISEMCRRVKNLRTTEADRSPIQEAALELRGKLDE